MADDLGNIISNMDNMSIEELGGSLLTRQSKINAEREKEARKSQKIQNALALIGIGQALTKDAVKKRANYINQTQAENLANNQYQAERWTVNANVINDLDSVDFNSDKYLNFKNNTNFNNPNTLYNFGENPTEGDIRAAYLHHDGYLDVFTTQFMNPINELIKSFYPGNQYEKLIEDSEMYEYLIDGAGLDIARNFFEDVGTKGIYKPKYELFMDEAMDLLTMDGYVDMDRTIALEKLMGLSPAQLDIYEKAYFNRQRNIRDKGLLGGLEDIAKKMTGISKRNGTVNIFDSVSKQDFYGNRMKADGQFELNIASIIGRSTRDRVSAIKTGASSELPIGKASNATIAYEADIELKTMAEGGDDPNTGIMDSDGRFLTNVYGRGQSYADIRNDIVAIMAVPVYDGDENNDYSTKGKFNFIPKKRRLNTYLNDLTVTEKNEMNKQIGILAKEMELNKDFARKIFNKMAGTIEGFEEGSTEVNDYFDRKYATVNGRLEMAAAMVARNGLYSEGLFQYEGYRHSEDIVDTFHKKLYPPHFNKNGGLLPELNNNIYIDKEGFKIKEDYYSLHLPQRANVFHATFEGIMNHNMPEEQRQNIMDSFFETIDHPVIGPTSLGQYNRYYSNEETRPILMATDEINLTKPANNDEIMKNFNPTETRLKMDNILHGEMPWAGASMSPIPELTEMQERYKNWGTRGPFLDVSSVIETQIPRMEELEIITPDMDISVVNSKLSNLINFTAEAETQHDKDKVSNEGAIGIYQMIPNTSDKQQSLQTSYNRLKENLPEDYPMPEDLEIMAQNNFTNLDNVSIDSQTLLVLSNYIEDTPVDIKTGEVLKNQGSIQLKNYLTSEPGSKEEKDALRFLYMNVHHKPKKKGEGLSIKDRALIRLNFERSYRKYF